MVVKGGAHESRISSNVRIIRRYLPRPCYASSFFALVMGCRYIFNVKCSDYSNEFLWQTRIITEPLKWVTVAMPLRELTLTRRGRIELTQLPLPRETVNGVSEAPALGRSGREGGVGP